MYTIQEDVEKIPTSLKDSYGNILHLEEKFEVHNEQHYELYSPGLKRMIQVMNEEGMAQHEWERREMHTEFWSDQMKERPQYR
jgi:hypothetical protein